MVHQLTALAALVDDLGSVLSTDICTLEPSVTQF